MIRQYYTSPFRNTTLGNTRTYPVGVIPVGAIVYIQDGAKPFGWSGCQAFIRKEPWIVEAWLPRHYAPHDTWMRGGHLAVVRSLRDGRRQRVADWILHMCIDAGLEKI